MEFFDNVEQKLQQIRKDEFYSPYIEELKALYEEDKDADITLDYQSFMTFYTTGSRKEYQDKYYARRRQLGEALMLYLLYEEQEYLDALCEIIWAICNELTWVLPAHLGDVPVENYRTHIDLFAAETAHSLAEVDYLVGDKLPERIHALIRCQVKERIFDAYESRTYFWERLETNWAGVCGGSVGMAYMYLAPERFEKVKDRLLGVMDCFMKSYGDDGSNTEGITYWQYGFWMYLNFADMLYRYSDGEIDIRHGEKLDKMAAFPQKVVMRGRITVSFSDSARTFAFSNIGLFSYLAKHYEGIEIFAPASKKFEKSTYAKSTWIVRNFLWSEPEYYVAEAKTEPRMDYLEVAEWYMVRKDKYSFAAKGGFNDEGHNHNDVGAFILATDKGQMIADLGVMEYTATCFSKYRYTLLQNSSLGHSVPIIDGKEQGPGRKYSATVCEVSDTSFVLELQNAYDFGISKVTRSFQMQDTGIALTDRYEEIAGHEITERFISVVEPQVLDARVRIGDVVLCSDSTPTIKKETLRNSRCVEEDVWLIDYKVTDKTFDMEIIVLENEG